MTALRAVPPPKLSAYCVACGEQHSVAWMRTYLETLYKPGHVSQSGGILCGPCLHRSLAELAEDDEARPEVRAAAQRVLDKEAEMNADEPKEPT
jgi:hypothetical protein